MNHAESLVAYEPGEGIIDQDTADAICIADATRLILATEEAA